MPVLDRAAENNPTVRFYKIDASKYGAELRAGGEFESVMGKVRGFPTIVHFNGKGQHKVHTEARTEDAVVDTYQKFVKGEDSSASKRDLTAQEVRDIQNGVVMFHWTRCGHCTRFMPAFREFSEWTTQNLPNVTVGTIEGTQNPDISKEHGVHGYPTIRIFQGGSATTYKGARSLEALRTAATSIFGESVAEEEFLSEDMARSILSLNKRQHDVTSLKPSAFNEALDEPAAIIMAHAPWCGYCKRFQPEFEKLSAEFPHIKFARINWDKYGTQIDGPVVKSIKTFPTLLVVKNGNVFKFEGKRNDLRNYMTEWFPN